MKFLKLVVVFVFLIVFSINVQALSVSYTQANADPGEVMKGKTFTVTASGWSGSCTTATISFAECSGCSLLGEDEQKSISGQSSVSWTTVIANQKIDTPQRI
ncbi:MAG TPA: hypothetical protein ENG42_02215, partial [Candidatus Aenigmarchaeota archaeon]|nr:hypothetical protein [Candidatus Aenigmarchaeota archaeon]